MKLYQTVDGTLIGFYQESGGAVQCTMYRDVFEQQMVTKERKEEIEVPGHYEVTTKIEPGYWTEKVIRTPGHYEPETKTWEAYTVKREREVLGHYEIQPVWYPEETVTKYYWREAHPARGLEAAWIPYHDVIPGYYKDKKVWVSTYTEEYEETIPAGEKTTFVWIPGYGTLRKVWVPSETIEEKVWVEAKMETKTVEYQELEEVWVGREPVYSYMDPSQIVNWEVDELVPAPADRPELEDKIVITNTLTGESLTTTARYLGLATRIDENEYVVP